MKTIITVIKKELKDTLRDRRTLVSAIVLPAIAIPLLFLGMFLIQKNLLQKEEAKQLNVALVQAPPRAKQLLSDSSFAWQEGLTAADVQQAVAQDSLDAAIVFSPDFLTNVDSLRAGTIQFYYKSTNAVVRRRITEKLEAYRSQLVARRIEQLNISPEILNPVTLTEVDVASSEEQVGNLVGGFLPYIFVLFCYLGCMYPALDLITGEKERGTIETLLTVPTPRLHLLLGKVITIALVGLSAGLMTILGMVVATWASMNFLPDVQNQLLDTVSSMLSVRFVMMLLIMLVPLALFFAGVLSAIVVRAQNFKEAQSYATPVSIFIIVPAAIAMIPGVTLNWQTVWIPILNIALATKEIIANTIAPLQFVALILFLTALAFVAVLGSIHQFSREDVVLK